MIEVIWADKVIFRCGRLHPHDLWLLPIHMFYCLKISVLDIFLLNFPMFVAELHNLSRSNPSVFPVLVA